MRHPPRIPRRDISGIFLLDKPPGISSNGALQRVRYVFGAAKGGHTGNLDVAASGLLPICLGEATKASAWLLDSDKCYHGHRDPGDVGPDSRGAHAVSGSTRASAADVLRP